MLEILTQRRTIRQYTEQPIDDNVLNELIEAACRVSTTGNMQLYSIIISKTKQEKEQLSPAHFNQPMIKNAPVVLTFCADYNRFVKWCEQRNAQPAYDNFQSFMAATFDATLAAQQFCTAAEIKGLGICYIGTTTYNANQIIEILKLPRLVVPLLTITIGYPAHNPEQVERLPIKAVCHNSQYTDYTPESINQFYNEKEQLFINQEYVKENNKKTLAQVFTDIRYPKSNNELFSEKFIQVLQKQGFLPENF